VADFPKDERGLVNARRHNIIIFTTSHPFAAIIGVGIRIRNTESLCFQGNGMHKDFCNKFWRNASDGSNESFVLLGTAPKLVGFA
jgi:hypothetical protein